MTALLEAPLEPQFLDIEDEDPLCGSAVLRYVNMLDAVTAEHLQWYEDNKEMLARQKAERQREYAAAQRVQARRKARQKQREDEEWRREVARLDALAKQRSLSRR